MEALKEMQDNQFQLAIVDPPYGIGRSYFTRPKEQYGNSKAKQRHYIGIKKHLQKNILLN